MGRETLTRADIAEALHNRMGLSRLDCSNMVESILGHLSDGIVTSGQAKISGFGTFAVRKKGARMGRNPKTGEEALISPRATLSFRASQKVRDRINGK